MPSGRLDSKKNLLPPLREKFVLDIPFHRTAERFVVPPSGGAGLSRDYKLDRIVNFVAAK
jgi:hypothetical protein